MVKKFHRSGNVVMPDSSNIIDLIAFYCKLICSEASEAEN